MYKNILFALCGCWWSVGGFAQSTTIESILKQVEQNNRELKALSEYAESEALALKAGNNLPNPQFETFYLPLGRHAAGNYTEFQLSQSFEFPTVYRARSGLIAQQTAELDWQYKAKRQEILAQAKDYCLNLVYLNKRLVAELLRVEQAQQVFKQLQELYKKEQVGLLELNKAKVAWMQEQFKVRQLESDRKSLLLLLAGLNGGNKISFSATEYDTPLHLAAKDSLWQQKLLKDPLMAQLKQQEVIARQRLRLARNKTLPNLMAGFNSQGVRGERFSGVYVGVSIPLWGNRNKVKAARARVSFRESLATSAVAQGYASFGKEFNDYQFMLSGFREYETTLSGLNSDKLLLQAYQLGELSFLEYYMELQFYRQAYDAMLEIQYQLYKSQNKLLKHQL